MHGNSAVLAALFVANPLRFTTIKRYDKLTAMFVSFRKLMLLSMLSSSFLFSEGTAEKNKKKEAPLSDVAMESSNLLIEEKPAESDDSGTAEKKSEDIIVKNGFQVVDSSEILGESPELPLLSEKFSLVELYGQRPEVTYWRDIYLSPKWQQVLRGILENAVEYRIYVRKCVSESEVPLELEYLPVVESGYKTAARSKSGAVGMWQFMENSVRPFLRLSEYLDERYDPWLSTKAGIAKLKDNHRYFNDWLIAIAAYNCGNGAMSRSIKKAGTKDYWELVEKKALPKQTAEYIPKLIAIADIAGNPEKYGIDLPRHQEEFENLEQAREGIFDYVEVKAPYLLSAIAKECGITEKKLKHLNPALTKGFTPPALEYKIRIPSGSGEKVKDAIARIKPIEFPFQYKVVKGDSLWSISRKFGVTVQAICDTNGIKENGILRIGKILYIPASKR